MSSALLFQIQSCLILGLLLIGISYRKNRKRHVKYMAVAMIWDVLLILQIELSREAIKKASAALSNPMILNIHVSFATLCVLGYIGMTYSGLKLLKGQLPIRRYHRWLGWSTLSLRILTFITSFFAVN